MFGRPCGMSEDAEIKKWHDKVVPFFSTIDSQPEQREQLRWKKKINQGCQGHTRIKRLSSLAGAGSQATVLHFRSKEKYFS
jgi:hypothetical protein